MNRIRIGKVAALALLAAMASVQGADAQSVRYAPSIRRSAPATPLPASAFAHDVFGEIVRLNPSGFILRLRSGRALTVDASSAIASGRFSQPLFVGKIVLVTGGIDSRGTFLAQTVTRITRIDSTTRADH
jgi:hypothetical protein